MSRILAVACALSLPLSVFATEPESATISPSSPDASFTGGPYILPNVSALAGDGLVCDDSGSNDCDDAVLQVSVPADFATANPGATVDIQLSWTPQTSDVDLALYDSAGQEIGTSGNPPGLAEQISYAIGEGEHTFTIRIIPFSGAVESANLTARLVSGSAVAVGDCNFGGAESPSTIAPFSLSQHLKLAAADEVLGAYAYFTTGSIAEQNALLSSFGLSVAKDFRDYSRAAFVSGPVSGFRALLQSTSVDRIAPNRQLNYLGDTGPWATNVRIAQEAVAGGPYFDASDRVLDGSGVTVTVLDSGLAAAHPDFEGRVVHNYKITGDFTGITPSQFVDVGYTDSDFTSGHGTHVTGTVGASGAMSTANYVDADAAPYVQGTFAGVAPGVSLQMYSVGDVVEPVGVAPVALLLWIDSGLQHMLYNLDNVTPRPRVASLSLGDAGGTNHNPADVTSCLSKALVDAGVSVVWAAGNSGGDGKGADDSTSSTCKDPTPGVICVASYDDAATGSKSSTLSSFSSRGRIGDPNSYPDIAAPGDGITSTCVQGLQGQITCTTGAESRWAPLYGTISGTSMATPHVAGAIALLYQARPDLTPVQVEQLLQNTARKVLTSGAYEADPQNPAGTINFGFGAGLLDLQAALDELGVAKQGAADAGATVPIIGADMDAAVPGAADVVGLRMTDVSTASFAGVRFDLDVRDATDFAVSNSVLLSVEGNAEGRSFTAAVRLNADGSVFPEASVSTVQLDGNTVSFDVSYVDMGAPAAGSAIHNLRMLSADGDTGAPMDYAPSTDGAPAALADQLPAYGRAFTVAAEAEIDPLTACEAPGRRLLADARGDIFALIDGAPENPAVPFYDLRELAIVQPHVEDAADYKIEFRLKVDGFPVLPTGTWPVNFCSPAFACVNPDTNTQAYGADNKYYTVRLNTDPALGGSPAAPLYEILQPTAAGATAVSRTIVPALAESGYDADGTIRLVVKATDIGLTANGAGTEVLSKFQSRVSPAATTPDNMPDGLAGIGSYTTLTLDACSDEEIENNAPVATAQSVTTDFETAVEITLSATDADGDNLSFAIVDAPANGTLGAVSGDKVTYTPNDGYSGSDAFSFKANDGAADSAPATVSITVNAAQDVDTDGDGILDKDEKDGCINDPDPACGETTGGGDNGTLDAELTVTPGADNFTFTFDASASHYEEGGTLNQPMYRFAFGDGETTPPQSAATISHSYDAAGTYRAFVVVSDANGNSAISEEQSVEVIITIEVTDGGENAARLTVDRATGAAPLRVTFDATGSTTADGFSISNYAWDFDGDGTVDLSGSNGRVQHVYTEAGNYTPEVTVTFTDDADAQNTETSVAKASVAATNNATPVAPSQKAGGGALGTLLLLPLLGFAAIRRKHLH